MNPAQKRILIIGGSTRAAASSARRVGFQPICADFFADSDTRQIAEIIPVHDYPQSLPEDVASVGADAWFYTGALENYPHLINQILTQGGPYGSLVGCSPSTLTLVRNPVWIAETLHAGGHRVAEVRAESDPPPAGDDWLRKPIASAGGRLIQPWTANALLEPPGEPFYFQRLICGDPCSAVFWKGRNAAQMLGATKQLIGLSASGAMEPFAYCGSVGPLTLEDQHVRELTTIANELADASGLSGLFGIDFQLASDGICVIEVNPRYPASVEILERATHEPVLRRMFQLLSPDSTRDDSGNSLTQKQAVDQAFAKVIVYTSNPIVTPNIADRVASCEPSIELADIPLPGAVIDSGWPVCTVIRSGTSPTMALERALVDVEIVRAALG